MRNAGIDDLDFTVIHCYPGSWQIPTSQYTWVNDNFIGNRAAVAAAAGKPLILEVRQDSLHNAQSVCEHFMSEFSCCALYCLAKRLGDVEQPTPVLVRSLGASTS